MQIYSQRFILCLLTGFVALMMDCGNLSGDAGKLVGAWEINKGIAAAKMTFSKDFTVSMQVVSFFGSGTATGEWRIEGKQLIILTKTNSLNPKRVGEKEIHKIVKIDDSSMILQKQEENGEWDTPQTLMRVK